MMNMNADMETLAGIVPAQSNEILYIENTTKAESFLQTKFNLAVEQMNARTKAWNDAHPDEEQRYYQEDIEVNMITTRMSSKFYPFLLILPSSVLQDPTNKRNKEELDIFNPQHTERMANMKKPLYELVKPFLYDDRDKNSFFSPTMQHELKISSRTAGIMKSNCRLKIHSFDKGRANYVAVFLDPLRVFHNMATLVADSKVPFKIQIDKVEHVKGGNYRYYFYKVFALGKGKNKKEVDVERQILQALTGRN